MVAGISAVSSPPPNLGPPLWLDDFCESLRVTYSCKRKNFHFNTPYCSDLSLWLNLFKLQPPRPANPGDPLVAVMPGGNGQINVTSDKVHVPRITSPEMALNMALLAMANGTMRAQGVKLEGTPDEIALLKLACEMVGLTEQPGQKVNPALVSKYHSSMTAAWTQLQSNHTASAQNMVQQKKTKLDSDMLHNPVSPAIQQILGGVNTQTYSAAKERVWNDQQVSQQTLMQQFQVNAQDAGNMIQAMKQEKLVEEPTPGQFHILVNKNVQWNPH